MADYVVKYDILCGRTVKELREKMREKLTQGWQPEGDLIKEENRKVGENCWHQKITIREKGTS